MNLIDREAAIEAVRNAELWVYYNADEPIEDIVESAIMSTKAAIEAEIDGLPDVELVRCKDCVHYEIVQLKRDGTDDRRYKPSYCTWLGFYPKPDGFCVYGERREGGTADK